MTKATAAALGVIVLLVVAAGLYASGPKCEVLRQDRVDPLP
jgi:hypothetical protein